MKKPPIHQKNTKNYDDLTSLSKKKIIDLPLLSNSLKLNFHKSCLAYKTK